VVHFIFPESRGKREKLWASKSKVMVNHNIHLVITRKSLYVGTCLLEAEPRQTFGLC
jgi:hypothetical protein